MKGWFIIFAMMILPACSEPEPGRKPAAPPAAAPAKVERIVIVSIDGLRPDLLVRTAVPNIKQLMQTGSFTLWARTTESAKTLPSHVSMLTGATPVRHDIWWNVDIPPQLVYSPAVPTLFEMADKAGHTSAMTVGKSKFVALQSRNLPTWAYIPSDYARAGQIAEQARQMIAEHRPAVMFIHFPDVDAAGHGSGWGSDQQLSALETCDKALGVVIDALREAKVFDNTVIILTADHGGAGTSHGSDDPRSRHVPWIISGPTIKKNHDLTRYPELEVNLEDTFATACHLLNLRVDEDLDGKPITRALVDPPMEMEMLRDVE